MYVNQRPQEVINAINDKFEVIMNHEKEATTAWVNMGKANETIFLGGKTVKSKDAKNGKENVGLMSIDSEAIFQKILIGRCVVSDGDDKCGHKPTFLDLGTGDGKLLEYLHSKFGIEYDRMIGISAGDHRMVNSTIPNQSYVTFNIDLLNQVGVTSTSFLIGYYYSTSQLHLKLILSIYKFILSLLSYYFNIYFPDQINDDLRSINLRPDRVVFYILPPCRSYWRSFIML